ncbi:MAG: diguanylate cyclase [Phycisphaerales bacterium]
MLSLRSNEASVVAAWGCSPAVVRALELAADDSPAVRIISGDDTDPLSGDADIVLRSIEHVRRKGPGGAASSDPDALVVVVAAEGDEDVMAEAVRNGAADAVPESLLLHHAAAWLDKALAQLEQRRAQRRTTLDLRTTAAQLKARSDRLEQELTRLEAMAWSDPLTGLANRRQLSQRLPQLFAEAVRYGKDLACLMIDLDHFKEVNDRLGHARGDELLCAAARLISSGLRTSDIAVRYGGDEFVVLMPQTPASLASQTARRLAERFELAVAAIAPGLAAETSCGMSVGVSCLRTSGPIDGDDLIAQADSALLWSKRAGKGQIMIWGADGRHADEA